MLCLAVLLLLAAIAISGWARGELFAGGDYEQLERNPFDNGWTLQYPWRAERGEWVGRDFHHVRGPLWQLLAWIGAGFGFHSAQRTIAGIDIVFPLLATATLLWIVVRSVRRPFLRAGAFVLLAVLFMWLPREALRAAMPLLVVQLYALPRSGASVDEPVPRPADAAWAAVAAAAGLMLSFDCGVVALASVVAMAVYGLVFSSGARPTVLRQAGVFAGTFGALQLILALLAHAVGASYFGYVADMWRTARSFTVNMYRSFGVHGIEAGPFVGLALAATVIALLFASRPFRDLVSGRVLAGALPTLVAAFVRTDVAHAYMAVAAAGGAFTLVLSRQLELLRTKLLVPCGVVLALIVLGWMGAHHQQMVGWVFSVPHAAMSADEDDPRYRGDHPRVVQWARARVAEEQPDCIGTSEALSAVNALADVNGPLALRWDRRMQLDKARAIRDASCPYWVHRMFTFYHGERVGGWIFGEDFLEVARLYRPSERLGPGVIASTLRDRPAPERVSPLSADVIGRPQRVSVPGRVELAFDRPIPRTALLRLEYTIGGVPEWARYVSALPMLRLEVARGQAEPHSVQWLSLYDINRRVERVVAVDPAAAEWRWIAGLEPREEMPVDRIALRFTPSESWAEDELEVTVHSVSMLRPGAPAVEPSPPPTSGDSDVLAMLRSGRAWAERVEPRFDEGEMVFLTLPNTRHQPRFFFEVRPEAGLALEGRVVLEHAKDDATSLAIQVIDVRAAGTDRSVMLAELELRPEEAATFRLPLDPWVGRTVLVVVESDPEDPTRLDRIRIERLALTRDEQALTFAAARRAGSARWDALDARLEADGSLFLHPRPPYEEPARAVWPLEPDDRTCLAVGLEHRGPAGEGDGAWFEVAVRADDERKVLLRRHLPPGQADHGIAPLPLRWWAGRPVEVELVTTPGSNERFDWAHFVRPQLVRCESR